MCHHARIRRVIVLVHEFSYLWPPTSCPTDAGRHVMFFVNLFQNLLPGGRGDHRIRFSSFCVAVVRKFDDLT